MMEMTVAVQKWGVSTAHDLIAKHAPTGAWLVSVRKEVRLALGRKNQMLEARPTPGPKRPGV